MNLLECENYLTTLDLGITASDVSEYNTTFKTCCSMMRETGEIVSKERYTDEELFKYTTLVFEYMHDNMPEIANNFVPKIKYLIDEAFLKMNNDGTIYKNVYKKLVLTDKDFCGVEK